MNIFNNTEENWGNTNKGTVEFTDFSENVLEGQFDSFLFRALLNKIVTLRIKYHSKVIFPFIYPLFTSRKEVQPYVSSIFVKRPLWAKSQLCLTTPDPLQYCRINMRIHDSQFIIN